MLLLTLLWPCLFTPKENLSWRKPRMTESLRLEKIRSPSPAINPTLPCSPLDHVLKCHNPHVFWTLLEMVIPRILSNIRDDLPSLKLSAEMPADSPTEHLNKTQFRESLCGWFYGNIQTDSTGRSKIVIQSSGDSYPSSSNGCGTEAEIRARAGPCQWGSDCRGLAYGYTLLPLTLGFWSPLRRGKKKKDPMIAIILYFFVSHPKARGLSLCSPFWYTFPKHTEFSSKCI